VTPPAAAPARSSGRKAAPRSQRRVSGPAGGLRVARSTAVAAPGIALPRPGARPAHRPTVPARRRSPSRPPGRGRSREHAGIALGLVDLLAGLRRSSLSEWLGSRRSLSGRTWIALVAFALIGIVTMQLGLLKLNASVGRALEHQALLQRENAALSIENSELSAGNRVESQAARNGMTLVAAGALRFLTTRGASDASRGAAALRSHVPPTTAGSQATTAESTSSGGAESANASTGSETEKSTDTNTEAPGSTSTSASSSEAATGQSSGGMHEASSAPSPAAHEETGSAESAGSSQSASASGGAGERESAPTESRGGEAAPSGR
jgi:cell division protein FtsL